MSWVCPHCGITATLSKADFSRGVVGMAIQTAPDDECMALKWYAVRCPSRGCGKVVLDVWAGYGKAKTYSSGARTGDVTYDESRPVGIGCFRFEPRVQSPLSLYVTKAARDDYEEACQIRDLSPKAAATLCRRALQAMIRDFWGVSKGTLASELTAIESQCDPALYQAMMGLKGVGNIGAHPERDVNLIVDVDEGEVDALLELLRILDREWYVAKARRAESLATVVALSGAKAMAQKQPSGAGGPVPPAAV